MAAAVVELFLLNHYHVNRLNKVDDIFSLKE